MNASRDGRSAMYEPGVCNIVTGFRDNVITKILLPNSSNFQSVESDINHKMLDKLIAEPTLNWIFLSVNLTDDKNLELACKRLAEN